MSVLEAVAAVHRQPHEAARLRAQKSFCTTIQNIDQVGIHENEAEADGQQDATPVGEAEQCPPQPVGKDAAAVLARAGEEDLEVQGCKGAAVRWCGGAAVRRGGTKIAPIEAIASRLNMTPKTAHCPAL